jgi:hypothetical protein
MSELTIEVTPETEECLRREARKRGQPVPDFARTILEEGLRSLAEVGRTAVAESRKPIWEIAADALTDVPQEELDRLSPDLSHNLDHYLYGTPKKQA